MSAMAHFDLGQGNREGTWIERRDVRHSLVSVLRPPDFSATVHTFRPPGN